MAKVAQRKDDEGLLPVKGMVKFDAGSGFPREGIFFKSLPLMVQILGIFSAQLQFHQNCCLDSVNPLLPTQRCRVDF